MSTTATASRRKFILNDLKDNHNKEYSITINSDGTYTAVWGRVGGGTQTKTISGGERDVDKVIAEKLRKGYREIILHEIVPTQTPSTHNTMGLSAQVARLINDLAKEAGDAISKYLSVTVDALSLSQIKEGRIVLFEVAKTYANYTIDPLVFNWDSLIDKVNQFYNTIPTILPHNLRDPQVLKQTVLNFCRDFTEQEQRLDQLEAAISSMAVQNNNNATGQNNSLLGDTVINWLDDYDDPDFIRIKNLFTTSGIVLKNVFRVTIPSERDAYETNSFGKHRILELTHGSRMANFRHILFEKGVGSGLKIPSQYTNGWMFGPGIYFADNAAKSQGYCSHSYGGYNIMVLSDVAVGDSYEATGASYSLKKAPHPYHSTIGRGGFTNSYGGKLLRNEYVVYNPTQQTIKYLVTF